MGPKITAALLTEQLTRMNAVFGNPKDRTEGQIRIMANEWHRALNGFGAVTVVRAITQTIETWKFGWMGALAEVVEKCKMDDAGWQDALGIKHERRHIAEPATFEREGRTAAEEIEFRAQQIADMKREAGMKSHAELLGDENSTREIKPASQDLSVSDALLNSKLVRELLAKQRVDADATAIDSRSSHTAPDDFGDAEQGQS